MTATTSNKNVAKEHTTKLSSEVSTLAESIASKQSELDLLLLQKAGKEAELAVWTAGIEEVSTAPVAPPKAKSKAKTSLKAKGTKGAKSATAKSSKPKAAPKAKSPKPKAAPRAKSATSKKTEASTSGTPLRERMISVMGADQLSIKEVMERLEAQSLMPDTKSPRAYISMMLSSNKDHFVSVARGIYKVKSAKKTVSANQTNGVVNKKAAKATASAKNGKPEESIEDLGSNVLDNPFA